MKFTLNQRVRVSKLNPSEWATGAVEVLQGLTGTVEEVREDRGDGRPLVVVRFDEHTRGHWHRYAHPKNVSAFSFAPEELELL